MANLMRLLSDPSNVYHPSIFHRVPRELGVYVLRRRLEPYVSGTGTDTVERVSVVGYSGDVRQTLQQYFCEHTRTAFTANYRNTAMALRDQVTHIDCYFQSELISDETSARAVERAMSELLEPMFRPPQESDNIGLEAARLARQTNFRNRVSSIVDEPMCRVRLPNNDNILSDFIDVMTHLTMDDDTDYEVLTVPQIREILRSRGLAVTGKKTDLIARLRHRRYGVQDE